MIRLRPGLIRAGCSPYVVGMRTALPLAVCLMLAAPPLSAQEPPSTAPDPSAEEGMSLIERGARMLLQSLLDDVEPRMKELGKGLDEAMAEMGPALKALLGRIDDFRNYPPPEMLPNGDIIIRRKSPSEQVAPDGQIEI